MYYLPTLAGYPAGSLLPIRGDLNGILFQRLAVRMYGGVEPRKFHGAVGVAPRVGQRYQGEWLLEYVGRSLGAARVALGVGREPAGG